MSVAVIIVAAGAGNRLGRSVPKAFVPLAGVPLLRHALDRALGCPDVDHVVVVAPAGHVAEAGAVLAEAAVARVPTAEVVAGGAERVDSVARGLAALRPEDDVVLVHDAARCLAPPELFTRVVDALRGGRVAVVPGIPVVDTIKQVAADDRVLATPERATLRAIQTPQGFTRDVLVAAHERAHEHPAGALVTDDAGLAEAAGAEVYVVPGDAWAAKITTADDLAAFERLLGA